MDVSFPPNPSTAAGVLGPPVCPNISFFHRFMDFPALFANIPLFHSTLLLVIALAAGGMIAVTVWLILQRCSPVFIGVSWLFFFLILFVGMCHVRDREQDYHKEWEQNLIGLARSIARETEMRGHWKIAPKDSKTPTAPDDPTYRGILEYHSSLCRDIPLIAYVFTLRRDRGEEKKVHWIVSCETDVNRDGEIKGPKETGEAIYSPYDEYFDVYTRGFNGEVAMDEDVVSDEYDGRFVTVVAPLCDPEENVEAILGIDFRWDLWMSLTWQMRHASTQLLALVLFLYLGALCFFAVLQRTVNRLRHMNQELIAAKKAADAGAKAKSDFLANMSHEIRTPMNAMIGFTEILTQRVFQTCRQDDRESLEGIIEIIRKSGQDLVTMINDILDFSKIEANLLEIESVPLSIKQILEDIWKMEMTNVVSKHLDFSIKYKEPIPELILGDPVRLRQVLTSLVDNAIKFTEKGAVTVHCETFSPPQTDIGYKSDPHHISEDSTIFRDPRNPYPGSTMLRFDIIDTGIGITQAQIDNMFQPFTQIDGSTTRRYGGTGLGLSIAKRLAQLMDGDISVTSKPNLGSTFTLTLHVYLPSEYESSILMDKKSQGQSTLEPGLEIRAPKADPPPEEEKQSTDRTKERPLRNARILLVEDMFVNQLVISTQLRDAGAMVEIVANGELGVQKVNQDMDNGLFFDVILMDMQMPVMDGYEATSTLRSQGYHRPIIAITAHALTGDREKTIEAGCDDYIAKPVDRVALVDTIKKFLK